MIQPYSLEWQTLVLTYRVLNRGWVGHSRGSAWRGMWGHALRTYYPEAYFQLFENNVSPLHPMGRRIRQGPVPYIISVAEGQNGWVERGEEVTIRLTLVGRACDWITTLGGVFDKMGASWGPDEVGTEWTSLAVEGARSAAEPEIPAQPFRLRLETPWIARQETRPGFPELIAALAERQAWLSHFFCGQEIPEQLEHWKAAAGQAVTKAGEAHFVQSTRFSNRKQQKMDLPGWRLSWEYHSGPPELLPVLWAGLHLGVGKGAAWGMGQLAAEPATGGGGHNPGGA